MPSLRTSIRLPTDLKECLHTVAVAEYGQRGISRWINDAVAEYFTVDPGLDLVGVGDDIVVKDQIIQIRLTADARERLEQGIALLRRQDPFIKDPLGSLLRAAIRLKLDKADTVSADVQ